MRDRIRKENKMSLQIQILENNVIEIWDFFSRGWLAYKMLC